MIDFLAPGTESTLTQIEDNLVSTDGRKFPIIEGIPRFVSSDNYAKAFGLQWKRHAHIQLDSYNGKPYSRERLERCIGGKAESLKDLDVLEVGCGAGRFTEVLVSAGAHTHSIDLSVAVEVNKSNIGDQPNYRIAQASVYDLPFAKASFDKVICLGVIQHTPSPEKTIACLFAMVKPGGSLIIDHYTWDWMYILKPIFLYRFFLKRMNPERAHEIVGKIVDFFFPLQWKFKDNKLMTILLNRISPLYNYFRVYPEMDREFHYELSTLDTYDGLTDYFKHLRNGNQIKEILENNGAIHIEVWKGGNGVEAKAMKKSR